MALKYPLEVGEENSKDRSPGFINFQPLQSESAGGQGNKVVDVPGGAIRMFIPNGLQFSDNVTYSDADLGAIGAAAAAIAGGGSIGGYGGDGLSQEGGRGFNTLFKTAAAKFGPEALGGLIGKATGRSGLLGAAVGSLVDTTKIQQGVSLATQRAINPNTKALLERVGIRQFNFQFTMIPTSSAEAEAIREIVKIFRESMYPEVEPIADFPAFLRYPNSWKIEVRPNGRPGSEYNVKFKDSFLTSASVSYNPTSTSYFKDGSPVETVLSLAFKEKEVLSRQDIGAGF